MKRTLTVFLGLLLIGGLISCTQKSEYEQLVDQELNRDVRNDTLFLGYYFGMPLEEFLEHSLELNRNQKIMGGTKILYKPEGLNFSASMEFYPEFRDRKIIRIPIDIKYDGWAPWNDHLVSDSLMASLVDLYEEEYNTTFITHTFPEDDTPSYVAVQGNRQIRIYRMDTQWARIEFLDLTAQDSSS